MCLHLLCTITISAFFMRPFRFRQSTTNQYQSIPIYLSIGIDNRYQSITTRIFAIDWSLIININRIIYIDWYRLISIVIDYRIHRLDTPGKVYMFFLFPLNAYFSQTSLLFVLLRLIIRTYNQELVFVMLKIDLFSFCSLLPHFRQCNDVLACCTLSNSDMYMYVNLNE